MTSNSLLASTSVAAKDRLFEDLRVEADFVAPPDAARLLRGRGLDANRRSNLIEWFVDVAERHDWNKHTVATAANILDRFVLARRITKDEIALRATCALFIASKFHETQPASILEVCKLATLDADELRRAEADVLASIDWRINCPSVYTMLGHMINLLRESSGPARSVEIPDAFREWIEVFAEISLQEVDLAELRPSCVALACFMLARQRAGEVNPEVDLEDALLNELRVFSGDEHPLNEEVHECMTRLQTHLEKTYGDNNDPGAADYCQEVADCNDRSHREGEDDDDDRNESPNCVANPMGLRMTASPPHDTRKRRSASPVNDSRRRKRRCQDVARGTGCAMTC
mmetsp:Transcript_1232/g.5220  ORF Transcript_1232/g.5220 Transcript_1232/m.5220 type:complete len:345 (-) Transcript_1232:44-1078(-)